MEGYIKLYRKLIESPVFENEKLLKIWVWCLCRANHVETDAIVGLQKIHLKKGQFIFGLLKASKELSIPKTTLYRNMKALETYQMISIKPENKYSVITIENWDKYQGVTGETEKQTENKRKTNGKQTETDKNVKNVKNDKNIYSSEKLQEIVNLYNRICVSLPRCTMLSDRRKKALSARLHDGFQLEDFEKLFKIAENTDFLSGRKTQWKANFDWLVNENNMLKVLEGNYNDEKQYSRIPAEERAGRYGDCDYSKFFVDKR